MISLLIALIVGLLDLVALLGGSPFGLPIAGLLVVNLIGWGMVLVLGVPSAFPWHRG